MLSVERSVALRIPPNNGPDRRESKIAIFDVTNSTKELRDMITRTCKDHCNKSGTPPIGIIFIETICDDKELLEENYLYKIRNSPDFEGLSEEQAMADLRMRAAKYEEGYEIIDDDSLLYVKYLIFSPKILANNVYGRSAKIIIPALMAWHVGERPIFLCLAGKPFADDFDMDVTLQSVEWNKGPNGSLDTPSHRGGQFSSMVQISNTPNNNGASRHLIIPFTASASYRIGPTEKALACMQSEIAFVLILLNLLRMREKSLWRGEITR